MMSQEQAEVLGHAAEHYVWRHSRMAQMFPDTAWEIAGVASSIVRRKAVFSGKKSAWLELQQELTHVFRYREVGLWWPVVRILLPIIARLVLQWWFEEQQKEQAHAGWT